MKLVLTPEQLALRATVRALLVNESPMSRVRAVIDSGIGFDPALWGRLSRELGVAGIAIPEQYGGAGFGQVEVSVVMEELGRSLAQTPFFGSCVLAGNMLLQSADDAVKRELLPLISDGRLIATLAVAEPRVGWDTARVSTTAVQTEQGWALTGRKSMVIDGDLAQVLLIVARVPNGSLGLFVVDEDASGMERKVLDSIDPTRRVSRIDLDATPGRPVAMVDVGAALARVTDLARVALAAEQIGGLENCVWMATEYACERYQFGRPIGMFQAVKHGCANMYVDWELAYSAVRYAAWACDEAPEESSIAAAIASDFVGRAYAKATADAIQIHGGIGFTWEHDSHFYYKRAQSTLSLLGDRIQRRNELTERVMSSRVDGERAEQPAR